MDSDATSYYYNVTVVNIDQHCDCNRLRSFGPNEGQVLSKLNNVEIGWPVVSWFESW